MTRSDLLTKLARRTNKNTTLDTATQNRLLDFLNERNRRILTLPGCDRLLRATASADSVASRAHISVRHAAKIHRVYEATNDRARADVDGRVPDPDAGPDIGDGHAHAFHPGRPPARGAAAGAGRTGQDSQPIVTNTSIETTEQVVLEWPQNSLEFEFAALSYNQPDKNQYAYFLEGFDPDWQYIGTKRDGRYTNLPGGDYTLFLKAANSNGVWNETPVRIEVKVIPPFWQTTWFRVMLVFALAGIVAVGIRLRTRAIQDRNRQLERLVRERTSALEKRNQEIQALYQADERILRNVSLLQSTKLRCTSDATIAYSSASTTSWSSGFNLSL